MKQLIDFDYKEVSQFRHILADSKSGYSFESSVFFEDGLKVNFARGDLACFIKGTYFNFNMDYKTFQDLIVALPEFSHGLDVFSANHTDIAIKAKIYDDEFYWSNGIKVEKLNDLINQIYDKIITITY